MGATEQLQPTVKLPCLASDIHGKRIRFVPLRERIEQLVSGEVQVVFREDGCNVGAIYISPIEPCHPEVYWFDQADVDHLFGR